VPQDVGVGAAALFKGVREDGEPLGFEGASGQDARYE
jgi:hypothetical protein